MRRFVRPAMRRCVALARLGALCMLIAVAAVADAAASTVYRLGAGDKVRVSVYGAPDLERSTTVNADGELAFPLIGTVRVAGLSVDEARSRIEGLLADGQFINKPSVSIDVTEYRPFFIMGDVSRPGAHPFQPGLTVRQAVALTGGYDLVRFHFGQNPFVQAAELRADYQSLGTELLRERLRLARLRAELDGKSEATFGRPEDIPVAPKVFESIAAIEQNLLRERVASTATERQALARVIDATKSQLAVLSEQIRSETDSSKQQDEDLARLKALAEKGVVPINRILDEQRSANLARSRLQDTQARYAQAQRVVEDAQRELNRYNELRRGELMRDITESTVSLERLKNRIEAAAEKFAILGSAQSAVLATGSDGPDVKIFRKEGDRTVLVKGSEDSLIEPGDVLQITLRATRLLGMALEK